MLESTGVFDIVLRRRNAITVSICAQLNNLIVLSLTLWHKDHRVTTYGNGNEVSRYLRRSAAGPLCWGHPSSARTSRRNSALAGRCGAALIHSSRHCCCTSASWAIRQGRGGVTCHSRLTCTPGGTQSCLNTVLPVPWHEPHWCDQSPHEGGWNGRLAVASLGRYSRRYRWEKCQAPLGAGGTWRVAWTQSCATCQRSRLVSHGVCRPRSGRGLRHAARETLGSTMARTTGHCGRYLWQRPATQRTRTGHGCGSTGHPRTSTGQWQQ